MELQNEFIFRSTDLPGRCFNFFAGIKAQGKFCDVTFAVGEQRLSVHRIIVAAAIPFFRDTLDTEDDEIMLPDVDPGVFECLIDFAYTCELKINMDNVRNLLTGACQLGMDEVRDACSDFIAERLSPDNALVFRDFAGDLRYAQLIEITDHYIKERFVQISETETFLSCPVTYLKELIAKDDLQVNSEAEVLEAILKWVKASPDDRKSSLPEFLRLIRLPLMNHLSLTIIVETEELIRTSLENRDLIDEARNFSLYPQRRKSTCSFSIEPRESMTGKTASCQIDSRCIYSLTAKIKYTVRHFDSAANEWVTDGCKTYVKSGGTAVKLDHMMHFCRWGDVLRFDSADSQFKCPTYLEKPRIYCGAASLKNRVYVCGGRVGKRKASNAVECYDPETDQWSMVNCMRTARWGLQVVALGNYIYALGGRDSSDVLDSVERYPSVTGDWTTMPSMLTKRESPGAAALNGKIYACGGNTVTTGVVYCATAEVYDPIGNKWEFVSSMNTARCYFSLVACCGKLYALGGKDNDEKYVYTCEIYDPENDKWTFGRGCDCDNFALAAVHLNS